MRLRWQSGRNAARFARPSHRWVGVGLSLGSALLFAGIGVAFAHLLATVRQENSLLFVSLVERTVFFLFLFLLAGGIPFVSSALLTPGDLSLLACSPLRPVMIVGARLLDAVAVSSGQFVVIGVPLLIAAGWALGLSVSGWVVFVPLLLLFLALPALLVAVLLLALARVVGVRRLRTAVAITSAVLSLLMCLFTVREVSARASGATLLAEGGRLSSVAPLPVDTTPSPAWLPSTWTSDALLALGTEETRRHPRRAVEGIVLLALLTALATGSCLALGGPVLVGERLLEQDGATRRRSDRRSPLDASLALLPLAPPVRALIAKDLRYVARDLVLLSQIGIPIILYLVPFVLAGQMKGPQGSGDLLLLSLGIVGTIVYMETSILGLSSIGLEGRAFWLVLVAPVSARRFVRAKFLFAFLTSLAVGAPLYAASCLFFGGGGKALLVGLLVLTLSSAALCGLATGLAGLFPRFVYDNPAHRASLAALIWGFVGASTYVFLAAGFLGGGAFAAQQWPEQTAWFLGGGAAMFALFSAGTAFVPLLAARARLEGYAWEEV